jgi:hypothetical protein
LHHASWILHRASCILDPALKSAIRISQFEIVFLYPAFWILPTGYWLLATDYLFQRDLIL